MGYAAMDAACQLVPFLYCIGFAITFSSLFSKIIRVLRIFGVSGGSTTLKKTRVKVKDMIIYQIVGMCIAYEQKNGQDTDVCATESTDAYGNFLESEGRCSAKDPDKAWLFLAVIMLIHFCVLLYSIVLCYMTVTSH